MSIGILIDHIGDGPAARLISHFGGLDVHIPKHPEGAKYERLVCIMGADIAAELVRVFGGECLYIAKNAKEARHIHRKIISERRANGETWQQIASTYHFQASFTERWVRKLGAADQDAAPDRNTNAIPANQPSLFDIPAPHPLDALSRRN